MWQARRPIHKASRFEQVPQRIYILYFTLRTLCLNLLVGPRITLEHLPKLWLMLAGFTPYTGCRYTELNILSPQVLPLDT